MLSKDPHRINYSKMINTRRTSGKRGERQSMFPSPMKTPGKR